MAGLDHGANPAPGDEREPASAQRTRYGLILFAVYLALYGGFVLLNAFAPAAMEQTPFAGVNLAVLYGLGLIAAAFVLALLYDWLCGRPENREGTR
jgi:uncharacterized membrane protein (DUF485 family)